jgi:hypothetical protein
MIIGLLHILIFIWDLCGFSNIQEPGMSNFIPDLEPTVFPV